jgi:AraC-like DNA-binding protein
VNAESRQRWFFRARRDGTGVASVGRERLAAIALASSRSDISEVFFSVELAKFGDFRITGLDISQTLVGIATQNARNAGAAIDFRVGNASAMPFADESFAYPRQEESPKEQLFGESSDRPLRTSRLPTTAPLAALRGDAAATRIPSVEYTPRLPLRPFVKRIWLVSRPALPAATVREHTLPTGGMYLIIRLSDAPIRIETDGAGCTAFGHAVVVGARSGYYVRHSGPGALSIGAELAPGATSLLFGTPANELAERHTRLDCLWGRAAELTRDEILEAGGHARQLVALEAILLRRLPAVRGIQPAVAFAIEQFNAGQDVMETTRVVGYSHRHFIDLFRRACGLSPKAYGRIMRFQTALRGARTSNGWARVAVEAGYSDQSHFNREFRSLTGITPSQYRRISPRQAHHVAVDAAGR